MPPFPIPAAIYDPFIALSDEYGLGEYRFILAAQINQESGWDPFAVGDSGHSIGLLQLHDQGQGAGMSVIERQDPATNLRVGLRAFRAHLDEFGSVEAALAAHNAGGPAVRMEYRRGGNWSTLYGGSVAGHYVRPILAAAHDLEQRGIVRDPVAEEAPQPPPPAEVSYRDRVSVSRRALATQLDAIWGETDRLAAGGWTGTAQRLRNAVHAIKDDAGLNG